MGSNIFFNYNSDIEPSDGCLLVSEPHLPDANFDRSVVLLCKHDDSGSFGFVLNRKSNTTIGELIDEAKGLKVPVYIGGPVEQNTLHFIHLDEIFLIPGKRSWKIIWGGDFEILLSWMKDNVTDGRNVRFFLGYSGWGVGQLEEEIKSNSWIVIKPDKMEFLFEENDVDMWKNILDELGGRFSMYSKYPLDPRLN